MSADQETRPSSPNEESELDSLRRRLEEAEAALEAKDREMERFTYIVSHDPRSPLLTIQGFADILAMDLEDGKSEAIEEDLGHIHKATQRMRLLLDDLLELSRIGRFTEPPSTVSVDVVIEDALRQVQELAESKSGTIDVAGDFPELTLDRGRVQQLFRILLDNALRYTHEGQAPKVTVGHRQDGDKVEFFVQDQGTGLEEEQLTKAFGPFERFSADSEGSGMGLAHAHRIVQYHQGAIRAESDGPGKGTTVFFSLGTPLSDA